MLKVAPLISICIPNFNYGAYLADCILSTISSPEMDIEILISDNCSTDNSWEIITSLSSQDSRIKAFRQRVNIGLYANWNFLVDNAKGKYIKILQSDDKLLAEFFVLLTKMRDKLLSEEFSFVLLNETSEDGDEMFQIYSSDFSMDTIRRIACYSQPTRNMFLRALVQGDRFDVESMRGDLLFMINLLHHSHAKPILNYVPASVYCRIHGLNDRVRYVSFEGVVDEMLLCERTISHLTGLKSRFQANLWRSSIITYCILRTLANFLGLAKKRDVSNLLLVMKRNRTYFLYLLMFPMSFFCRIRL